MIDTYLPLRADISALLSNVKAGPDQAKTHFGPRTPDCICTLFRASLPYRDLHKSTRHAIPFAARIIQPAPFIRSLGESRRITERIAVFRNGGN